MGTIVKDESGCLLVTVTRVAVIKKNGGETVVGLPRGYGFDGFRFNLKNENVEDAEGGTVTVNLGAEDGLIAVMRGAEEKKLTAAALAETLSDADADDFKTKWIRVTVPEKAVYGEHPGSTRIAMPDGSAFAGRFTSIPNAFRKEIKQGGSGLVFSLPDTLTFKVRGEDGCDEISCGEFADMVNHGTFRERAKWETIDLPGEALVNIYEKCMYFQMPRGPYGGRRYYIPAGMVKKCDTDGITLRLPETKEIRLKNAAGEEKNISFQEFRGAVEGKGPSDYPAKDLKPGEKTPAWKSGDGKLPY